jgi:hypothetical protein
VSACAGRPGAPPLHREGGLTTPLCGPAPRYGKRDSSDALLSKLLLPDGENQRIRSR